MTSAGSNSTKLAVNSMEIHKRSTEVPDLPCQDYLLDVLTAQLESVRLEQLNDLGLATVMLHTEHPDPWVMT
jgi:hypothetical protein